MPCLSGRMQSQMAHETGICAGLDWNAVCRAQHLACNRCVWTLNGAIVFNLENCIDLDLGFTPATNLVPLRRLALRDGQAADVPAAWLDVSAGTLEVPPQHYERRVETKYWYEAQSLEYVAMLEVNQIGFIRRCPGLWEAEM